MVFSSFPAYLDHPNWHQLQQPNYQQGSGSENPHVSPPPPPPPPPQVCVGGGSGIGSIRPGSMVDRARVAKLPQPEPGLKCPRCDSTNTKFCYFNNYSLTQPRHFCKTCRRYWTRGGSLRNVPVGGGCRRNKRSKSSSSKSQAASQQQQKGPMSSSASPSSTDISSHFPHPSPQLPFMATLQNLIHYGGGNAGGLQPQMAATGGGAGQNDHMAFQLGSNSGGTNNILFSGGADQWRLPFLSTAGFEQPTNNLYPFYQSEGDVEAPPSSVVGGSHLGSSMTLSSGVTPQLAPVKMEDNQRLNLSRQLNGSSEINQYWVGNTWTDFSGLNSSSH